MKHALGLAISKTPTAISLFDDTGNGRPPALAEAINLARMGQEVQILIIWPSEERSDLVDGGIAWTKSVVRLAEVSKGEFAMRVVRKKRAGAIVKLSLAPPPVVPLKTKLDQSVNELEMTVRGANCLQKANIRYVGELVLRSDAELLKLPGMGRKDWKLIREIVLEQGLKLGMDTAGWTPPV